MNSKFSYNGVVTIIKRTNNDIILGQSHNNGASKLFEAYSRALAGQDISNLIPGYIDIYNGDDKITTNYIPITINYKDTEIYKERHSI